MNQWSALARLRPYHGKIVGKDEPIRSDEMHSVDSSSSNEDAIEGIFMVRR